MEIRLAQPEEFDAVGDLMVAVYVGDGYVDPDSNYVEELRATATRASEAEVWVAVEGDELLGTVTNCPKGSRWKELASEGEGEFRMLAVAEIARGRGLGGALVRHCVAMSRAAGDRGMVLSTMDRMTAAHRIYGRLGFHRAPEADWSPASGVLLLAFRLVY
jgi:GNAT superfamily N-acetyltransferase